MCVPERELLGAMCRTEGAINIEDLQLARLHRCAELIEESRGEPRASVWRGAFSRRLIVDCDARISHASRIIRVSSVQTKSLSEAVSKGYTTYSTLQEQAMSNPFEDENGRFHVLVNEEGQYSIWPIFINAPCGWAEVYRFQSRRDCLEYVNKHWTDMRPSSLVKKDGEPAVK